MVSADPRPRRRADAERSIARIVSAARGTLSRDPSATVDDIATAAGVGRMTVYGHFRTRPELVEAALVDALRAGEQILAGVDLGGDARQAMNRLLVSSWSLVAESAALLTAAQGVLTAERLRDLHDGAADRVEQLIRRGQRQGVFRTDLPLPWLVNAVHYILNGAAEETRLGRLDPATSPTVVTTTVQAILAIPAAPYSPSTPAAPYPPSTPAAPAPPTAPTAPATSAAATAPTTPAATTAPTGSTAPATPTAATGSTGSTAPATPTATTDSTAPATPTGCTALAPWV